MEEKLHIQDALRIAENLYHGLNAAAGQQSSNFCLLGLIAQNGDAQQLGQRSALDEESHQHAAENTDAHGDLYVDFKTGKQNNDQGRNQSRRMQDKVFCKQSLDLAGIEIAPGPHAQQGVKNAGNSEGNQGGSDHSANVSVQICLGDGAYQQGAGGHGRTPVSEEGTGQSRTAAVKNGDAHTGGDSNTDDTHGGGSTEGGTRQKGNQTAQQEADQYHAFGITDSGGVVDDIGDGAAGPPDGGDDTDEQEGNQNVLYGFYTGKGQNSHFPDRVLPVQTVTEKQEKTKDQSN